MDLYNFYTKYTLFNKKSIRQHDQKPWQSQVPKKNISKDYPEFRNWWECLYIIYDWYIQDNKQKGRKTIGKWLFCHRIRMCKKNLYTSTKNEKSYICNEQSNDIGCTEK